MEAKTAIEGAIGPLPDHCSGYLEPGASGLGYIATLKLAIGCIEKNAFDRGLAGIVSYDQAERLNAYIGQINMITASSFCGPSGVVWGYDLAIAENLHSDSNLFTTIPRSDGIAVPIRDIRPLLDATMRLFGTVNARRFPLHPGAMVICANKNTTVEGPTDIWCSLALAIAEDRSASANLFIEDTSDTAHGGEAPIGPVEIAQSMMSCGRNQDVLYKEIFVGTQVLRGVPAGYVACAMTCAPYVTLAQRAVPEGLEPSDLAGMTINAWESALGLKPLGRLPALERVDPDDADRRGVEGLSWEEPRP